jgi:predicted DCC family thiol-disulfide oxidoreductase YuxK
MKKVKVFYDGACPSCQRDRRWYDFFARKNSVDWCDITGRDDELRQQGIDPDDALTQLHVENAEGRIVNDIEAYQLLFDRILIFKPVAWLMGLPWIKEWLRLVYRKWVNKRLTKEGRLPSRQNEKDSHHR